MQVLYGVVLCLMVVLDVRLNALHVNQTLSLCESKAEKPSVSTERSYLCSPLSLSLCFGLKGFCYKTEPPPPPPPYFPEICVVISKGYGPVWWISFVLSWRLLKKRTDTLWLQGWSRVWRWRVPSCWQQITNLNNLYSEKIKLYVMLLTCLWLCVHDGSHSVLKLSCIQVSAKKHSFKVIDTKY